MAQRYGSIANGATSAEEFADAIQPMLAELRDLHVWIELPDGPMRYPFGSSYQPNFDHEAVRAELTDLKSFPGIGFTGRTESGMGVIAVTALPNEGDYESFCDAVDELLDSPGIIVDLRSNRGGDESKAARIAGRFAPERTQYARTQVRTGGEPGALREVPPRFLNPVGDSAYTRPVACLLGPGCVSSGEGFALMMKSLPHVTTMGQPTRGASGNPQPVNLSNGVRVWFSRWISLELDGTPIEERGVTPKVTVAHSFPGDTTFAQAEKMLLE